MQVLANKYFIGTKYLHQIVTTKEKYLHSYKPQTARQTRKRFAHLFACNSKIVHYIGIIIYSDFPRVLGRVKLLHKIRTFVQ